MYDSMIIMAIITCIITSLIMVTSSIHGDITVGTTSIIINLIIIIRCIIVVSIMMVFTNMHRIYVPINIINVKCIYPCPKRLPPC